MSRGHVGSGAEQPPPVPKTNEFQEGDPFLGNGVFHRQVHGDKISKILFTVIIGERGGHGVIQIGVKNEGLDPLGQVQPGAEDLGPTGQRVGPQTGWVQVLIVASGEIGGEHGSYRGRHGTFLHQAVFQGQVDVAETSMTGRPLPAWPRLLHTIGPIDHHWDNRKDLKVIPGAIVNL